MKQLDVRSHLKYNNNSLLLSHYSSPQVNEVKFFLSACVDVDDMRGIEHDAKFYQPNWLSKFGKVHLGTYTNSIYFNGVLIIEFFWFIIL